MLSSVFRDEEPGYTDNADLNGLAVMASPNIG